MSKYQLNKALKLLTFNIDAGPKERYAANPKGYVSEFNLTAMEARALLNKDIGAMYGMGVQPFILVAYAQYIWGRKFESFADLLEFQKEFSAIVAPYGYPDMTT